MDCATIDPGWDVLEVTNWRVKGPETGFEDVKHNNWDVFWPAGIGSLLQSSLGVQPFSVRSLHMRR